MFPVVRRARCGPTSPRKEASSWWTRTTAPPKEAEYRVDQEVCCSRTGVSCNKPLGQRSPSYVDCCSRICLPNAAIPAPDGWPEVAMTGTYGSREWPCCTGCGETDWTLDALHTAAASFA